MFARSLTIICVASTGVLAFGGWPRDGGMPTQGDWVVAGMGEAATLTPPPIIDTPDATVHRTAAAATSWFAWTLSDGVVGPAHADDEDSTQAAETIPRFSTVVMDPQSGAVFEGTGRPGTSIVLWKQGWVIGRADVEQDGRWAVRLDKPFDEGDHEVTVATRQNNSAKVVYGQEVRIAIPKDFRDGPPVTYELREETPRKRPTQNVRTEDGVGISEALRRRAEELARAAHNRFNELTTDDETPAREKVDANAQNRRIVQQTTPAPQTVPVPERKSPTDGIDDGVEMVLTPVVNWLKRAARDYQTTIVPGLSEPARRPGVLIARDDPESGDIDLADNTDERDAEEQRRLDREAQELRRRRLALQTHEPAAKARPAEATPSPRDEFFDEQERLDAEAEAIRRRREQDAEREAAERNRLAAIRERAEKEDEERRRAEALRKQLEERERQAEQEAARLEAERRRKLAEQEERQRRERERRLEDRRLQELARQEEADRRAREEKARAERKAAEERRRAKRSAADARRRAEIDAKARRGREIARLDDDARSRPKRGQDIRRIRPGQDVTTPPLPATDRKTRRDKTAFVQRPSTGRVITPANVRIPVRAPYRVRYDAPRKSKSARVAGARYRYDDEPLQRKRCHRRAGVKVRRLPGTYIVARGDTLWAIARRHYRRGHRYPIIYHANRRKIRDPDLIYPCQRFYLPKRKRR